MDVLLPPSLLAFGGPPRRSPWSAWTTSPATTPFYDPNHDAPVEVIPTVLADGELPRYPPTTSIAHLQERFGATLPYLDEAMVDREPE